MGCAPSKREVQISQKTDEARRNLSRLGLSDDNPDPLFYFGCCALHGEWITPQHTACGEWIAADALDVNKQVLSGNFRPARPVPTTSPYA